MRSEEFFRAAERIIRPVSWLTLIILSVECVLKHVFGLPLPGWFTGILMPVLTAAAVGYLTNYIAIEMLFKPYLPTDRHWLRYATFGWWKQGLVPANKDRIGRVLGEEIPRNLIDPDELAEELGRAATEFLQDRDLLERFRATLLRFLQRNSAELTKFLLPYVEGALRMALRENLTTENLRRFWDEFVVDYLDNTANREQIAAVITQEFQRRSPDLALLLRNQLKAGVREYLIQKLHLLPSFLVPADLAAGLVDYLDWEHIQLRIAEKLDEPETRFAIREELAGLSTRIRTRLESPESQAQIAGFLSAGSHKLEEFLHEYLLTRLPDFTDAILSSERLWNAVEQEILPAARKSIGKYLRGDGKAAIIARLNLAERIERAVCEQDIGKFHRMIGTIADEHLIAIQVLGYLLGGIAGLLLAAAGR